MLYLDYTDKIIHRMKAIDLCYKLEIDFSFFNYPLIRYRLECTTWSRQNKTEKMDSKMEVYVLTPNIYTMHINYAPNEKLGCMLFIC